MQDNPMTHMMAAIYISNRHLDRACLLLKLQESCHQLQVILFIFFHYNLPFQTDYRLFEIVLVFGLLPTFFRDTRLTTTNESGRFLTTSQFYGTNP